MNVSRRDVLRRLGGMVALAGLYGGSRLITTPREAQILAATEPSLIAEPRSSDLTSGSTAHGVGHGSVLEEGRGAPRSDQSAPVADDRSATTDRSQSDGAQSKGSGDNDGGGSTAASEEAPQDSSPQGSELSLSGAIGPIDIPNGTVANIVGDVNLQGDVMVAGTLTGVDSFTLEGNGFQIMAHNGGRIRLVGRPKTGWARVGDSVSGWSSGDRVAVAPMAAGDYSPKKGTWGGSWGSVGAPAGITLLNGAKVQAEVANLTRSITIRNVSRIMFMDGAGPAELRHIAVVDSGDQPLGFYPIHFHLNGSSVSGSVVEGVVVEGGRNRAFVPHGSHGIQFRDCVAYNTRKKPFWWDPDTGNESFDIKYEKCLAMLVTQGSDPEEKFRLAGFELGRARRSSAINCASVAVQGQDDSGGFWWPGGQSLAPWDFRNNVSHNNEGHGYIVWQNTNEDHFLSNCIAFRNSEGGVDHGAYKNQYRYEDLILQENRSGVAVRLHANATDRGQMLKNIRTDGHLHVENHTLPTSAVHQHVGATYSKVVYREKGENPSHQEFVDCGLAMSDFDLGDIHPGSTIRIVENGKVVAGWEKGSWS